MAIVPAAEVQPRTPPRFVIAHRFRNRIVSAPARQRDDVVVHQRQLPAALALRVQLVRRSYHLGGRDLGFEANQRSSDLRMDQRDKRESALMTGWS